MTTAKALPQARTPRLFWLTTTDHHLQIHREYYVNIWNILRTKNDICISPLGALAG